MKKLYYILLACLFCSFSFAEDPAFSVTAKINQATDTSAVLTVSFSIPGKHLLYADMINVAAQEGINVKPKNVPLPEKKYDPLSDSEREVYKIDFKAEYYLTGKITFPLKITVDYQGCDDTVCFLPESKEFLLVQKSEDGKRKTEDSEQNTETIQNQKSKIKNLNNFVITGSGSGYLNPKDFIRFLEDVETGKKEKSRTGLLLIFFILIGGLALNLTPCVLPMIPINIAIIGAGAQASSRRRGFALGGAYGLGIAITYGILGLIVVLTGSKFGALNSSAWFNIGIAALFVVLALAMFDIFQIDFTKYQSGLSGIKKGTFFAAFFIGSVAALLAGACVAPVVIYVLVLSANLFSSGNLLALFLPFLLGLGMGLPWPFVGSGLSFLPKPGAWMNRVKYVFGVFILAFALYYGWIGYRILKPSNAVTSQSSGWETSLEDAFAKAKIENKPVFIDFWATWCKNCTAMDKTTFKNPEVIKKLEGYVKVKFQAERLDKSPTKEALDYFEVKGLPTYVIGRVE